MRKETYVYVSFIFHVLLHAAVLSCLQTSVCRKGLITMAKETYQDGKRDTNQDGKRDLHKFQKRFSKTTQADSIHKTRNHRFAIQT